ncbi:MAG TPA: hypothetical protein VK548_07785 [Candidatus Acidoferrum sp.]|nr:hypothetical protein [Candidatus Acidoferrum sp.]
MQTFAQLALPGTILASALGAVVLCVVVLLYGFKSEPDDDAAPVRRLLFIRLGYALAAACFAVALMLSTVALLDQRRVAAAATIAAPTDDVQHVAARVRDLEQRLAATESRAADGAVVASVPATVEVPVSAESRRPAASLPARSRKVARASTAPASDNFGATVREGWDAVKRGFRETGRDIQASFSSR